MTKRETRLLAIACTFIGIVIGFFIAIKAGTTVSCGDNNTLEASDGKKRKRRSGKRFRKLEEEPAEELCEF